jgi:hypothetical protein
MKQAHIYTEKKWLNRRLIGAQQGLIQDFKLGGTRLKKLRRAERGAKMFGVFRVKNRQKINFFPILGGSAPAQIYDSDPNFLLQNQSQIVYKRYSDAYTSPCIIYVNNNFCLIRTILQITWQLFLIFLHCRINTIYVHCRKISNPFALAAKQDRKNRQRLTFLPVSKARTNYFYIFQQCTLNHSFFKIFIIIRFSSFDNISRRHTSWIIRVFCVHSFSTETLTESDK